MKYRRLTNEELADLEKEFIRFLADYCNDDVYYGAKYEGHNLVRAGNQMHLLNKLEEKKEKLLAIVAAELKPGHISKGY